MIELDQAPAPKPLAKPAKVKVKPISERVTTSARDTLEKMFGLAPLLPAPTKTPDKKNKKPPEVDITRQPTQKLPSIDIEDQPTQILPRIDMTRQPTQKLPSIDIEDQPTQILPRIELSLPHTNEAPVQFDYPPLPPMEPHHPENEPIQQEERFPNMDNEYMQKAQQYLEPVMLAPALESTFQYLSETRDLDFDFNSERYKQIHEITDKMSEGFLFKPRVVIMRKGNDAFIGSDGTIFLAQGLINKLDTLDEVGAVLAHEINHLIHMDVWRTNSNNARLLDYEAVGWLQEFAADIGTMKLLEKAGLSSDAFRTAIMKLDSTKGFTHQSGGMRALEVQLGHEIWNYDTSDQPQQPMPETWKQQSRLTNLEIINNGKHKRDYGYYPDGKNPEVFAALAKLHRVDLEKLYSQDNRLDYNFGESVIRFLSERLRTYGYTESQILTYFSSSLKDVNFAIIKEPEQAVDVFDHLHEYINDKTNEKIENDLFGIKPNKWREATTFPLASLLYKLMKNIKVGNSWHSEELPVTEDSFIHILQKISEFEKLSFGITAETYITKAVLEFIDSEFSHGWWENGKEVNLPKTKAFLYKLKAAHIPIKTEQVISNYQLDYGLLARHHFRDTDYLNIIDFLETEYEGKPRTSIEEKIDTFFQDMSRGPKSQEDINKQGAQVKDFLLRLKFDFNREEIPEHIRITYITDILTRINGSNYAVSDNMVKYLKNNFPSVISSGLTPPELLYHNQTQNGDTFIISPDMQEDLITLLKPENLERYNQKIQANIQKMIKFNLQLMTIKSLFKEDSQGYYDTIVKIMNESGINSNNIAFSELMHLSSPLFKNDKYFNNYQLLLSGGSFDKSVASVDCNNYDLLTQLPFIKDLIDRNKEISVNSMDELYNYTNNLTMSLEGIPGFRRELFSDSLTTLIITKPIQEAYLRLLKQGIPENQLSAQYKFIRDYFPEDPGKKGFLKEYNLKILSSPSLSLQHKINHLRENIRYIGPEGLIILGEQIQTIEEYRQFRYAMGEEIKKYLSPSSLLTQIAAADYLSMYFNRGFDLIASCDSSDEAKVRESTKLAEEWVTNFFTRVYYSSEHLEYLHRETTKVEYDPVSGKIVLDDIRKKVFRSYHDLLNILHDLTPSQRFAIASKLLVEEPHGALVTSENRSKLATYLNDALQAKGFMKIALEQAIINGDQTLLALPAAAMIGPLLFTGYDEQAINYSKVMQTEVEDPTPEQYAKIPFSNLIPNQRIPSLMQSTTQDIVFFGREYKNYPQSVVYQLAEGSRERYYEIYAYLEKQTRNLAGKPETPEKQTASYKGVEAVISGIQKASALGVRALQLTSQFFHFSSPELNKRLAESFDNNPGMNKLVFWENLYKMAEDGKTNPKYKFYEDFVWTDHNEPTKEGEYKLVSIGDALGQGSLFTTRAAKIVDRNGNIKDVALKQLNPNAVKHIEDYYKLGMNTLEQVILHGTPEEVYYANMAKMILDLSQNWCLKDINDKDFDKNDELFRSAIIAVYNQQEGNNAVFAPVVYFNQFNMQCEELVSNGVTLNKFLHSNKPAAEIKKTINQVVNFYQFQMHAKPAMQIEGKDHYIVHSDPNIGNFIVGRDDNAVAVLDRRMYLILNDTQMNVGRKVLEGASREELFQAFIEAVCEDNNIRTPEEKLIISRNVLYSVGNHLGLSAATLKREESFSEKLSLFGSSLRSMPKGIRSLSGAMKQLNETASDETEPNKVQRALRLQRELNKLKILGKRISRKSVKSLDSMEFLQIAVEKLSQQQIHVSLNTQLAVRNASAMRELQQRYAA